MASADPKLPNFQLALRGSVWNVQWYAGGKRHAISTGCREKSDARSFLVQYAAGFAAPAPPKSPSISAILDGYLAERKGRVASYGTLLAACSAVRRHLGELEAASLTRERGRLYATQRTAEGHLVGPAHARIRKPTANGTIIREVVTLRAALKWAVTEKWLTADECPYVPAPSQPQPRDRWLSRDEFEALLTHAKAPHLKLFLLLALHTGARCAAVLELQWTSVKLDRGIIQLGAGVGNKLRATVPINHELHAALVEAFEGATSPYVVEFAGSRVLSVKTAFNATCRRAGVEDCSPHIIRHTAATWMAEERVPMSEIARYLGHTDERTTARIYAKHSPEFLRNASNALTRRAA